MTEDDLLHDYRICRRCKKEQHVFDMKIFLTGEVSKYCKGCYSFNPLHHHKIFNLKKYLKKGNFTKFSPQRAIRGSKYFGVYVKNGNS